eukprot:TRINITY_DN2953_c0_g1_i1.p1 TRINITY_DN2953_c0_g1~~TRINITY_DN2953_c0_g1_i1.p1  ORF type:complete len:523 (+),score=126.13 TRINITY_DN2953_c0_g1_i1:142-1710(+)
MQSTTKQNDFPCTIEVNSPRVHYSKEHITTEYTYRRTRVEKLPGDVVRATPVTAEYTLRTTRTVPKVGLMLVGLGGNNGTTLTAGVIANKHGIKWETKTGVQHSNYFGSLTQCSVTRLGNTDNNEEVNVPLKSLLPMLNPSDLIISGWDINGANMAQALKRAQVMDFDLQRQLYPYMEKMIPLPSVFDPKFIAANQSDRADNVLKGTRQENLDVIRGNIRDFKMANNLESVIVLWTANTERYAEERVGLNDTEENLLAAIKRNEEEIAPSTIFAVACILEHVPFINGSPQNTLVPGVMQLAEKHKTFVCGDDFKTGQTKIKSVLADFLVSAGLKLSSIVSYNHLGNNDGKNLSAPATFRSKEISKGNVVTDVVSSNPILYAPGEHPDHVIVIKYVPNVGDSKRAMDEYTSEIYMGGRNTIALHNTCEDSLLAAPIMLDLVVITELMTRIQYKTNKTEGFENFDSVLSVLSYLLKAPRVPKGTPVINVLARQRECIENILRACIGLDPVSNMLLECKSKVAFH